MLRFSSLDMLTARAMTSVRTAVLQKESPSRRCFRICMALTLVLPVFSASWSRVASQELFVTKRFGVRKTSNLRYGAGTVDLTTSPRDRDLLLDLYEPTGTNVPVLKPGFVLVHGGGWRFGSKDDSRFSGGDRGFNSPVSEYAMEFAKRGYVCAVIDYRKIQDDPGVRGILSTPPADLSGLAEDIRNTYASEFPLDQVRRGIEAGFDDTVRAINWLVENAEDYGVDPTRIVVGGYSAGSVNSLWATYVEEAPVRAVWSNSGGMGGGTHVFIQESTEPPAILFNGDADVIAPVAGVLPVLDQLEATSVPYEYYEMAGEDHFYLMSRPVLPTGETIEDLMTAFFFEHVDLDEVAEGNVVFTVTPDGPEGVQVDGAQSTTPDGGSVDTYEWDFGDGSPAIGPSGHSTGSHRYAAPGRYTIRLTVTGNGGLWMYSEQAVAVQLTGAVPAPWVSQNIGEPTWPGGARLEEGCFLLQGSSGQLSGRADRFHFSAQAKTGNFSLVGRLADWRDVSQRFSMLGLMVRDGLDVGARHGAVVLEKLSADFRHRFLHRDEVDGSTASSLHDSYEMPQIWLRVDRRGDRVLGFVSEDGVAWSEPDVVQLPGLAEEVYVGMAAAKQPDVGVWSVATICDLTLEDVPPGFLPSDCNEDGALDISDGVCLLGHLFQSEPIELPCGDGSVSDADNIALFDSNGDDNIDISDAVRVFGYLFSGAPAPARGTECVAADGCPDACRE